MVKIDQYINDMDWSLYSSTGLYYPDFATEPISTLLEFIISREYDEYK